MPIGLGRAKAYRMKHCKCRHITDESRLSDREVEGVTTRVQAQNL